MRRIQNPTGKLISIGGDEIDQILTQQFSFLARGRQCFAFESQDGNYILKLPRTDIYKIPFWTRILPVESYRKELQAIRSTRKEFVATSFLIAHRDLQEHTETIAMQLGKGKTNKKQLKIVDPLGLSFELPLENTSFILQKKHPLLMQAFQKALQQKSREKAKEILGAFVDVVAKRAEKKVFFRDRSFLKNFGFENGKGYLIDIGDFYKRDDLEEKEAFMQSLQGTMEPLREWLAKEDPQSLVFLEEKLSIYEKR